MTSDCLANVLSTILYDRKLTTHCINCIVVSCLFTLKKQTVAKAIYCNFWRMCVIITSECLANAVGSICYDSKL